MIHSEPWFIKRGASLSDERDRLHNAYERKLIDHEEFARKIHTLYQREHGTYESPFKLLREHDLSGKVLITQAWVEANEALLTQIQGEFRADEDRVGGSFFYAAPMEVVGAWHVLPSNQKVLVVESGRYFALPMSLRAMVGPTGNLRYLVGRVANKKVGGKIVQPTSDEDFTDWVKQVLEAVQWLRNRVRENPDAPRA